MSAFYNVDQPPFNMGSAARAIAAANNGLLFDPSDMSTMFQDSTGATPVTAMEQPVGLWLDKSQGLMLGAELVTNGDFSNGLSGWSPNKASLAVVNGEIAVTNQTGAADEQAEYDITASVSPNKFYKITLTGRQGTATSPAWLLFETDIIGLCDIVIVNEGKYQAILKTPASYDFVKVRLRTQGVAGGVSYFDNISVREIYGNHATQSITAYRPVLSARKNILLATETLATQSVTTLAAQYTLSFTGTGSVTLSGSATGTLTGTGANDRVSFTITPTAGTLTLTVSGSVTNAQLELGASAGPYQRVNTSTDYDTNPALFPKYLKFDGIDDYMNLPYMGLYANGSASVVVARDELTSQSTTHSVSESSSVNNSRFYCLTRSQPGSVNVNPLIRTDSAVDLTYATLITGSVSPLEVRSVVDSGSTLTGYKNTVRGAPASYSRAGATVTLDTTLVGALNFGGVFADFSNMKLYGLIITKSALTDAQRIKCERFLARKAGVML